MNKQNPDNGGMDLSQKKSANVSKENSEQLDFGINCLMTLQTIAGALEGIAIELSDLKDNSNRRLLHENIIVEDYIIAREEKAAKAPKNKREAGATMAELPDILADIEEAIDGMAVELSDIKDNSNRQLIAEKLLTEIDIVEREKEDDGEPE